MPQWLDLFIIPLLLLGLCIFLIFLFVKLIHWFLGYAFMCVPWGVIFIAYVWRSEDNFVGLTITLHLCMVSKLVHEAYTKTDLPTG